MPDLIYSRKANNDVLHSLEIEALAPAVYAHDHAENLTNKYGNFNSANAIEVMRDYGYGVTQAAQVKGRTAQANIHGQHLLAFSKHSDISSGNNERPEIIFYNSHDGKSSMKLFAGIYRFICSNGIVAGEGFDQKMIHYKSNLDNFEGILNQTADRLYDISSMTNNMKNITPNSERVVEFAKQALETRFDWYGIDKDERERNAYTPRSIRDALTSSRVEDNNDDAWTIFNRVQESVLRGGIHILGNTTRRGRKMEAYKKSKALTSIKQNVDINRALWDIAQETLAA